MSQQFNWGDWIFGGGGRQPFGGQGQAPFGQGPYGQDPYGAPPPPPRPKKPRKQMSKKKALGINFLVTALLGLLYWYVALPAINLQSSDFYVFIAVLCVVYCICAMITSGLQMDSGKDYWSFLKGQCKPALYIIGIVIAIGIVGSVISSPIFRAASYRELLTVTDGDFAQEVEEISYNEIPMLDEESAKRLGDRQMGELEDMVSQFEVADDYTQINYQNRPVRVASLNYGDIIKWITNRSEGLPAYIVVDMVTQEASVVRLEEGMRYSPSEHFGRHIVRHLRFHYPTFMFGEPTFEVDESGHPWWVCPREVKTIGLFGGNDINGAVLVDAVTGESTYYQKEEIPNWVDRVYTAELILQQYDYHGTLVNGFINSILGQRGVTVTTAGSNYIAMNDDVYLYTGITSVSSDQSNVGFILSNQRTKETSYYSAPGATEYSAMASAQGVVQHLHYSATFPLLLNISGQPTYFMALKDDARLVKMYAMVNVSQYHIVATGSTVAECEANYVNLMHRNDLVEEDDPTLGATKASGRVAEIRSAVMDGNSYYFLRLEDQSVFYSISAVQAQEVVILDVGDWVELEVAPEQGTQSILEAYSLSRTTAPAQTPIEPPAA